MARIRSTIDAPAERVFAILSDPCCYPRWVVGAQEIRRTDGDWPGHGSRIHHSVGVGPLRLCDSTEAVEVEAPRRLVLEARGRPFGRARIEVTLRPAGGRTEVTMDEEVSSPSVLRLLNGPLAPLIRVRNAECLRRLARLATES